MWGRTEHNSHSPSSASSPKKTTQPSHGIVHLQRDKSRHPRLQCPPLNLPGVNTCQEPFQPPDSRVCSDSHLCLRQEAADLYLLYFSWGEHPAKTLLLISVLVQVPVPRLQVWSSAWQLLYIKWQIFQLLPFSLHFSLAGRKHPIFSHLPSFWIARCQHWLGNQDEHSSSSARKGWLLGCTLCPSVLQVCVLLNSFPSRPEKYLAWICSPH